MSTEVQEYLRGGKTLEDLARKYAIKATPGREYPNLVGLKYNMRESPLQNPLVRECRGIVLDRDDDWRCVARGFDKFFNYGEPGAAEIDWSTARVQEKIDGTLCLLYYYDGGYQVATTGHPEAGGPVVSAAAPGGGVGGTFADLFFHQLEVAHQTTPEDVAPWATEGITAMIEMACQDNRLVCGYEADRMVLLGGRDSATGREHWSEQLVSSLDYAVGYDLSSAEGVIAVVNNMTGVRDEGVVVVDEQFRRVKFKAPSYLRAFQLRFYSSVRSLMDVARFGGEDEVLRAFPWLQDRVDDYRVRLRDYAAGLERQYDRIRHIADRKAFALEAIKTDCAAFMFQMRDGHVTSAGEYLSKIGVDAVLALLDIDPKGLHLEMPSDDV